MPFALAATGMLIMFLAGCRKEEKKPEIPASSPASYMNDKKFMGELAVKRKDLQAILRERAPLVKRMEELIRAHGKDLATLQKIPEWNELHKKVTALNAKYEETRAKQLKVVRERITPGRGSGARSSSVTSGGDAASPLRSGARSSSDKSISTGEATAQRPLGSCGDAASPLRSGARSSSDKSGGDAASPLGAGKGISK